MTNTTTLPDVILRSRGQALSRDENSFGFLADSSAIRHDIPALRERFAADGYLYLRGFFPREAVLDVRREVTDRLAAGGYLNLSFPAMDAVVADEGMKIVNANSAFRPPANTNGKPDPIKSYRADQLTHENKPLNALLYSGALLEFYREFLGGPVRHFNYTWFRVVSPGFGTPPHCDLVYMGRGTRKLYSTWTPLGDVPLSIGGLMILENSHCNADRLGDYLNRDVDEYCTNGPLAKEIESGKRLFEWDGTLSQNPVELRENLGGRWLTAQEYRAGDILIFGMQTIHGSLDNQSNTIRISSDSRYQLASEPIDPRYIGENPVPYSVDFKRGRIC